MSLSLHLTLGENKFFGLYNLFKAKDLFPPNDTHKILKTPTNN